jgi:hypothetical protein
MQFTLDQLLEGMNDSPLLSQEDQDWLNVPDVGREIVDIEDCDDR